MKRKLLKGLIVGALLGVVCIVGASLRSPEPLSIIYLGSFWFNRVMMGMFFVFIPEISHQPLKIVRGIMLGLLISLMFYSATDFNDFMGFIAGAGYGIILEYVVAKK